MPGDGQRLLTRVTVIVQILRDHALDPARDVRLLVSRWAFDELVRRVERDAIILLSGSVVFEPAGRRFLTIFGMQVEPANDLVGEHFRLLVGPSIPETLRRELEPGLAGSA